MNLNNERGQPGHTCLLWFVEDVKPDTNRVKRILTLALALGLLSAYASHSRERSYPGTLLQQHAPTAA